MAVFKKARYEKSGFPPWTKLQRAVYLIVAPGLPFQVQCRIYPMHAQWGRSGIPRYWITLGKEIIWDYPKQFVSQGCLERHLPEKWLYANDISNISCLIREYLDTPRAQILTEPFVHDMWGVVDILRAADRRVGSRQWEALQQKAGSEAVRKIIAVRKAQRAVVSEA